jgi:hypothetical protein
MSFTILSLWIKHFTSFNMFKSVEVINIVLKKEVAYRKAIQSG